MPTYVALIRALNVGGTGKLPMRDLKRVADAAGFSGVRTHGVSGNAVFDSPLAKRDVAAAWASRLSELSGKPVGVLVRTSAQLTAVLADNPFPDAPPDRTAVLFLDRPPTPEMLDQARGRQEEELRRGTREIYIHYPLGIGRSRLRLPASQTGTARNINTVRALLALASAPDGGEGS